MINDRIKHILAGLCIAILIGLPVYLDSNCLFSGIWSATLSGVIAATIKEWCDNIYEWEWSWKDFGYTCAGTILAVIFIILLHVGKG